MAETSGLMTPRVLLLFSVLLLSVKPSAPLGSKLVLTNAQLRMLVVAFSDFGSNAFPEMHYPESPATSLDYGATLESLDGGTMIRFAVDSTYKGPYFEGGTVRYEFGVDGGLKIRVFEK